MKRFLMALAIATALVSCKESVCRIEGNVDNMSPDMVVYLTDMWSGGEIIDSARVVNNRFTFKAIKHEPTFAHLVTKSGRPLTHMFVEKATLKISGDANLSEVVVSGTPANDALMAMMKESSELLTSYNEARAKMDEEAMSRIEKEYEAMQQKHFEENTSNFFGLFMLQQLGYSESAASILKRYALLSEEVKAIPMATTIKENAERRIKTEPQAEGSDYVPHYINIVQQDLAGKEISLKEVIEKSGNRYVLLDFWASWCGPCMHEMPYLREAYKLYHKKGFEIYGVSLDKNKSAWEKAVKAQKMEWVNVSSVAGFENQAADEYCVNSIPTNFLIDCATGVIIAKNLRGDAVKAKLAELLK